MQYWYVSLLPNQPQITLGEMVSYLPLPGGWFTITGRTLNPSFVVPSSIVLTPVGLCMWMDLLVDVLTQDIQLFMTGLRSLSPRSSLQ